jgi:ABC-type transport system involved in cytochrome bd biosynthesis fused ATPase/permease subunit
MEALTFLKAVVMAVIVPVLLVTGGTLLMILDGILLLILAIQHCNACRNLQRRWHRAHHKLA